jgi:ATP-dependent Clp protease ATP-binding subunit ClpB
VLAEAREQIVAKLKQVMRPEFLNRIDEIVMFKPLLKEEVANIAKLQFDILAKRLAKQNLKLEITDEALKWLAEISYDVNYGARPIKRTIQKKITDPLSMHVLSGELKDHGSIIVDTDGDGKFIFKISE